NAGHAAATSSSRQPGIVAKLAARSTALADSGGAGAADGGARGGEGSVAQPTSDAASIAARTKRRCDAMAWLLLEALVALLLAVFIVWFTMGGKRKEPPRVASESADRSGADDAKDGN
ncbi:MAG TPA: hypothetical protein VIH15_01215, partial [Casimicrobiaceae bacterium]